MNKPWSEDNIQLSTLLSVIDFNRPINDSRNAVRRLRNQEVLRCHPDKNQDDLAAANSSTILWNAAFGMANEFLDVCGEGYDQFTTGDTNHIINFMLQWGLSDLQCLRDEEADAEHDAHIKELNRNAIDENKSKQRLETLYEGYHTEHLQQQQSMYMLVYIYMYIYMYDAGIFHLHVYIYVYVCVYIYVYIHIYIYIYIYILHVLKKKVEVPTIRILYQLHLELQPPHQCPHYLDIN
jgi:hypothetical protein